MIRFEATTDCLAGAGVALHPAIKALILLSVIPQKWESIVPVIIHNEDIDSITAGEVKGAILAQYEMENTPGRKSRSKKGEANKLSNIKCKHSGPPQFNHQSKGRSDQQHGAKPQTSDASKKPKRGKRGKGKGKAKEDHIHFIN